MKKFLAIVLALCMVLALAACGGGSTTSTTSTTTTSSGKTVEIVSGDTTAKGAAGNLFHAAVVEAFNAKGVGYEIDYHPNGELGGDEDLLRQAQSGDIGIVVCQTAPTTGLIPEMAVFDLPMVFAKYDGATIDKVLNGDNDFHNSLAAACEAKGYHLLGFLQNATFRLTSSNQELADLAAFKGLQIRTMSNPNHVAFWQAIGANPTPLAWAEVPTALQTGMLDAQENAADTIANAHLQDMQKYLSCTNHILYLNVMLMNKDAYDALPDNVKTALDEAVKAGLDQIAPNLKQIDADNKAVLEKDGMTITEYPAEFYDEILNLQAVKDLYAKIDADVNGLGTKLQAALDAAA